VGLIDDLGAGPIGLDTAVFIYFVEEHTEFLPLFEPLFVGVDGGRWSAVTSSLTSSTGFSCEQPRTCGRQHP
jgi:hypothetical protein